MASSINGPEVLPTPEARPTEEAEDPGLGRSTQKPDDGKASVGDAEDRMPGRAGILAPAREGWGLAERVIGAELVRWELHV
jgi:hypothetical protein